MIYASVFAEGQAKKQATCALRLAGQRPAAEDFEGFTANDLGCFSLRRQTGEQKDSLADGLGFGIGKR